MRKVPDSPKRPKRAGETWNCWRHKHDDCQGFVRQNHGQKTNCSCGCHKWKKEALKENA
jgi:hypothetical protein